MAKVQAELGIIPQPAAEEIIRYCRIEEVDFTELHRQVAVVGAPISPLVQQIVRKVNTVEQGLGMYNLGATS